MNPSDKRIAIVASSCPPFITRGMSSAHFNLYKMFKSRGYKARLFTFTDHKFISSEEPGVDVIRNGTPSLLLKVLNLVFKFYHLILRRIENFQFAYQFPYILESAVGSMKINRSLREFKPNILILPDNGSPGYFIKKPEGCQTVFISHHNYLRFIDEPLLGGFSRKDAEIAISIESKVLKKVDKVICPSRYMKDFFDKTHNFVGEVSVLPNLLDDHFIASIPVFDIRKNLGLPSEAPVVYIPSAGSRLKGSRFVFEIIRRLSASYDKGIGFYLSGEVDDELKRELKFVQDNAKIYCPGNVNYIENISVVKGCSYCVSPTLIESFGMAILEANFCGLPVVTFNVGGNADIIFDGENGYLASFLDVEKMISLSIKLLDDDLRERMRQKTLNVVSEKFSIEIVAERYLEFLFENKL